METNQETTANALILMPEGRLDFGAAAEFQAALENGVAEASGAELAIIVDCAKLDYVSSAGLRSFLVGARTAREKNVGFHVCSLVPGVAEVFKVSGFGQIIPPLADRAAAEAAVAS